MKLNELSPADGSKKSRQRVGRGVGSGWGKTAGRGSKGQGARSGGGVRPGYEGGQMPIHRRLPKRGFTNIFKKNFAIVNIRDLTRFESGSTVDEVELVKCGLIKGTYDGIKLLGQGEIDYPLQIKVNAVSESARKKISSAGGTVEVV
jgi:large subunit ribosomal protein L15